MKLKDLLEICRSTTIELHSSKDGSLVATSRESLKKYGEVTVRTIYPKIKVDRGSDSARTYLYVYGDSVDIYNIKQEGNLFETMYGK